MDFFQIFYALSDIVTDQEGSDDWKERAVLDYEATCKVAYLLGLDLPKDLPNGDSCPRAYSSYDLGEWLDGVDLSEEMVTKIKNLINDLKQNSSHQTALIDRCELMLAVTS